MRSGYTLSGKKIDPSKESSDYSREILYALNRKQSRQRAKIFEGTDNPNVIDARRKAARAAKKARRNRGDR